MDYRSTRMTIKGKQTHERIMNEQTNKVKTHEGPKHKHGVMRGERERERERDFIIVFGGQI